MDTGLAAYLSRWPDAATLENGPMDGAFLETHVVTEIVKSYYNAGKVPDLYYYRDNDKNFRLLKKLGMNIQPGLIMCMTGELVPYNRDSWYCPISVLY